MTDLAKIKQLAESVSSLANAIQKANAERARFVNPSEKPYVYVGGSQYAIYDVHGKPVEGMNKVRLAHLEFMDARIAAMKSRLEGAQWQLGRVGKGVS